MKKQEIVLILPIIAIMVLLSGCLTSSPGNPDVQRLTSSPTVSTVKTTTLATTSPTLPAGNLGPQGTPVAVPAYVKRPFGYVQYTYNPDHMVTLQESHVETEPDGTRTIVGTIKNTGSERVDLVVVTVNLYNANGNIIGSTSAEAYYLEPNKVWKFRTEPFSMSDFAYHQIAETFTG